MLNMKRIKAAIVRQIKALEQKHGAVFTKEFERRIGK